MYGPEYWDGGGAIEWGDTSSSCQTLFFLNRWLLIFLTYSCMGEELCGAPFHPPTGVCHLNLSVDDHVSECSPTFKTEVHDLCSRVLKRRLMPFSWTSQFTLPFLNSNRISHLHSEVAEFRKWQYTFFLIFLHIWTSVHKNFIHIFAYYQYYFISLFYIQYRSNLGSKSKAQGWTIYLNEVQGILLRMLRNFIKPSLQKQSKM